MLGLTDIKTGKKIILDGQPYTVLNYTHSKTGRAGAVLRTKLQNIETGATIDKTFQGADKVEEADISKSKAQYLYAQGSDHYFMDMETFDQFSLSREALGSAPDYLTEEMEVTMLNFDDTPINIELPVKVTLTVTDAPPGLKGDTQSGGDKRVTVETGLQITTPLFVNTGDKIIINTEKALYVSRA